MSSWQHTLRSVLTQHNKTAAVGGKAVSFATQAARQDILWQGFKSLRALGYRLKDVTGFKERHMTALAHAWEEKGLSASTLQNRISIFRIFSEWIGKPGMIRRADNYVKDPKRLARHLVTRVDKTWSGQGQTLSAKLAVISDPWVALQLELQRAFGLRMKEAALLHPHQADKQTYLAVNWGTKGGRDRIIPIDTAYQRETLTRAQSMVSHRHHSMIPAQYDFKQWRHHYYYVCRRHGISRKDGITSHGLRHERLNELYRTITGQASPIQQVGEAGKTAQKNPVDASLNQVARQEIAEVAGHSRAAIAGAYIGHQQ